MLAVKCTGVLVTASSAAGQGLKHKCKGSVCPIANMSGLVANKGLVSPVYNSSNAAVIQPARSLAMEWSPTQKDGTGAFVSVAYRLDICSRPWCAETLKRSPG